MELVPISENTLINIEQIESMEIREINGNKTFIIIIGGRVYIPTKDSLEVLKTLISKGVPDLTKQYFSV